MTDRTPTQIFADVAAHRYVNPTHGVNCACLDQYIRELAQILNAQPYSLAEREKQFDGNLNNWFKSEEYKIVMAWEYMIRSIATNFRGF